MELHRKDNYYFFSINSDDYAFIPLSRRETELLDINQVIQDNSLYDQLIFNIEKRYMTQTQRGYFVLIKMSRNNLSIEENIINEKNMVISSANYMSIDRTNWKNLWSKKIDYIEYQLLHIENDYPIISKSINYYIGMTETAIGYLNDIFSKNKENISSRVVSHKRILDNNFNSPMNIIIDYRARDISEYLKYIFIKGSYNYDKIGIFLSRCNLSTSDSRLVYARMFYPTFYFDLYDQIVSGKSVEDKLIPIINRNKEYEEYVNFIYNVLSEKKNILKVEWI